MIYSEALENLMTGLVTLFLSFFGFIVYIANTKDIKNKLFFLLTISAILWNLFNFLYNLKGLGILSLWFLRIHLLFAIWYAFFITLFFYVIFEEKDKISFNKKIILILIINLVISILVLTPLVFKNIMFDPEGRISIAKTNWGIICFGILIGIYFVISIFYYGIYKFLKKFHKYKQNKKIMPLILIVLGFFITFLLHIIFNFIYPNIFNNPSYTKFGIFFSIPFIAFSGYAILRYKFLDIRILITEIFVGVLLFLSAIQILYSTQLFERILRLTTFVILIFFGIRLIRLVRSESEQREKLEQLNRIKSEFLSFASHQLKAPMAVVKGYAELIAESIENVPEQAKDFAKKIKGSVNNLLELVENFMDYRRIEEGKLELHFEEIEIVSLIKELINNFQLIAKEKNLELTLNTQIEQFIIKADKTRITQVIQNLIDNAIKYTPQGWVRVTLSKDNDNILITVADSGIGISKELQSKLFGEFVRDPSIKKEIRGTGLGLYIAKNIVEAHQGQIWAESEGEGKGSKFFIRLPLNI